jgi:hypothetical protein
MDRSAVLSLVIGFLQLVLVVVVVRELGRYARTFPWLVALTAFFALRGAMRIYRRIRIVVGLDRPREASGSRRTRLSTARRSTRGRWPTIVVWRGTA